MRTYRSVYLVEVIHSHSPQRLTEPIRWPVFVVAGAYRSNSMDISMNKANFGYSSLVY